MNRTGFKIFAIILLLFSIVFQGTYIAQGKKEKEIPSIDMLDSDENQLKEQKSSMHIPLEDYINKLNGYEYFKLGSIHIIDDYYEVKGKVVGDSIAIKDFFSYLNDVMGYRIKEYLVYSTGEQIQMDIVLEMQK